jgi:chorismate mutase
LIPGGSPTGWVPLLFQVPIFVVATVMPVRGIRGATCAAADEPTQVQEATRELLHELLAANKIDDFDDVISAVFTTTQDLTSTFPAEAARAIGMQYVPLLCASEIPVPDSMPRCIRVLLHVHTDRLPRDIVHVYLREARQLRPDIHSAQ